MKFRINQRVELKHSHTGCKTGTVIAITVSYTVKQDDGLVFVFSPGNLEESKTEKT